MHADQAAALQKLVDERTAELQSNQLLLQTVIDSSFSYIQVFKALRDEHGEIVDFEWRLVNKRFVDAYGDMTGRRLLANNPAVTSTGIFDEMIKVVNTGEPCVQEHYYKFEQFDGWFHQILAKMEDGLIMTTNDITKRKQAELQLEEHRNRLQSILDTTLVQLAILDAVRDANGTIVDFKIKMVNKEMERETGRLDLEGKYYAHEYPGIKKMGLFELIVKTVETGEPQSMQYFYEYDGFQKWFSSMFVKLEDGVVATNVDISAVFHLKATETALQKEREIAGLREQFIAVLGHDLRNPLTAIRNVAQLLLTGDMSAKDIQKFAAILDKSGLRMAELIGNVMDLASARLGSGISVDKKEVDVRAILSQVIDELQLKWPNRQIIQSLSLPERVFADGKRLGQLFSNLLGNALHHGNAAAPVRITGYSDNEDLLIEIVNAGKRIPAAMLANLFQPFVRGTNEKNKEGLGLGLFISSEIAKAHDGQINVRSDDDETVFIFRMPL
ncbi:MAG: ATP-binding protein [Mucilaginibacter sp.]